MPKILTLNLHCYQEDNQLEKFQTIARAIFEQDIDYVALQEVAQHKDAKIIKTKHGVPIKEGNAALLIVQELETLGVTFDFAWDWSHYGWQVWEEGVAILSKHPMKNVATKYVSKSEDSDYWLSRKILRAELKANHTFFTLTSVHLGFWADQEEPFENQFENLLRFINSEHPTLIAGDFNIEAGTTGYEFLMRNSNFRDLDLECNPDGMFAPTIGGVIDGWPHLDGNEKRIDYLFTNTSKFHCKKVNRIFTEDFYGEVSDHFGLMAEFDLLD